MPESSAPKTGNPAGGESARAVLGRAVDTSAPDCSLSASFRFDTNRHEYIDLTTGAVLPHITGLLKRDGMIDDEWFTEESSERGRVAHDLAAQFDLGALDVASCTSKYRAYLLAWVECMSRLRPTWLAIEEANVHPFYKFGGRIDRIAIVFKQHAIVEIKSGVEIPSPWGKPTSQTVQTALQAILASAHYPLPAEQWSRYAVFLKANGRYVVKQHTNPRDFWRARSILERFACSTT